MTLLSAKWLNKFHINIIVHVVFPENIHTPPQRATEIYSSGGGGESPKGNNFRGVGWIQVFSGVCKQDRWDNKNKQLQLTITLLLAGVSKQLSLTVLWMRILDGNILEGYGNSRGGGGLKQKCPLWGGEGEYGYFLELHMMMYCFSSMAANYFQLIKYISQTDIPAQLFQYEI